MSLNSVRGFIIFLFQDILYLIYATFCVFTNGFVVHSKVYLSASIYLFTFQNFLYPMLDSPDVPDPLIGKHEIIFGNIEEIYEFHNT